jgi:hypothetical protein
VHVPSFPQELGTLDRRHKLEADDVGDLIPNGDRRFQDRIIYFDHAVFVDAVTKRAVEAGESQVVNKIAVWRGRELGQALRIPEHSGQPGWQHGIRIKIPVYLNAQFVTVDHAERLAIKGCR